MDITPVIPDGYTGPIKRLTCSICKHIFYITQDDYHRHPEVRFCHECSLILREELEKTQGAASNLTLVPVREKPAARVPLISSVAPIQPIPLPQPRTINREKMTIEQLLEEAKMLRKTWRYKEALRSYEEALRRDTHCLKALYGCASMLSSLDRPREALAVYEELLCLEPGAKAASRKGNILMGLKHYDEALAAFDIALQFDSSYRQASFGKWFVLTHLHRDEEAEQWYVPRTKSADDQQKLTQPCHTSEDYRKRGDMLRALGRDEEALRAYERCLHLDPFYFEVYERIYLMHYRKDNCGPLVAIFDRAVQAFPTFARLHLYRAELLGQDERYQDAVEACNRAIESDSTYAVAYKEKSEQLHHLKRAREALESIEQAIALDPDAEDYYRHKAEILANLRQDEEALVAYDQAIRLDPDNDYSYWAKARFLAQLGRDEDVLATYDQFIERFPAVFKGYQEKLFFLSKRKRYEDGLETCDTYLQQCPHHAQAYEWKGRLLSHLDRPEEALLCYEEVIRLQPQDEDAYVVKAGLLVELKRYDEALSIFDQALQLAPDKIEISKKKGKLLIKLKRYEEALPLWQKTARLDPNDASLQDQIGDILSELGQYEEAIQAYNRAIRLDRSNVYAYRSKASVLEKLERYQEARMAFEEALIAYDKALQSEPEDFFLHFFRADVLKHLHRYDEAMAVYDKAQHLAPRPFVGVYCIFGEAHAKRAKNASVRLQLADKEINEKTIEAEIELMHKEEKLAPMKQSILFQPICQLMLEMQEWSGTPKQFKELLSSHFPDAFATWYKTPRKFVEELKEITPALQEEGVAVSVPPETTLVMLTSKPT